jgi:protein TonB
MNRYTHSFVVTFLIYTIFVFSALYMLRDIQKQKLANEVVVKMMIIESQQEQKKIEKIEPIHEPLKQPPKESIEKPIDKLTEEVEKKAPSISPVKSIQTKETTALKAEPNIKQEQAPQKPQPNTAAIKDKFIAELKDKIRGNKYYPMAARRREQEGSIAVKFCVHHDGSVSDIICNGPHSVLREAAKDAIAKTFPVNVPQNITTVFPLDITLALDYKLE